MRFKMCVTAAFLVILATSCAMAAPCSPAALSAAETGIKENSPTYKGLEGYMSFSVSRTALEGDFDGESFFSGAGLILLVPELESSPCFGAVLGVKRRLGPTLNKAIGAEMYCERSGIDGKWLGLPGDGVLWDVGAALSFHFAANRRVQPYLRGSMGFTGFDFDLDEDLEVDTCPFAGTKWAFDFGVSVYLNPKWFLDLGFSNNAYRFGAPADKRSIVLDPPLKTTSFDFDGRISFRF